jgi:hypothetical protein
MHFATLEATNRTHRCESSSNRDHAKKKPSARSSPLQLKITIEALPLKRYL